MHTQETTLKDRGWVGGGLQSSGQGHFRGLGWGAEPHSGEAPAGSTPSRPRTARARVGLRTPDSTRFSARLDWQASEARGQMATVVGTAQKRAGEVAHLGVGLVELPRDGFTSLRATQVTRTVEEPASPLACPVSSVDGLVT